MRDLVPGLAAAAVFAISFLFVLGVGRGAMVAEITNSCDVVGKFIASANTVYTCAKEKKP